MWKMESIQGGVVGHSKGTETNEANHLITEMNEWNPTK